MKKEVDSWGVNLFSLYYMLGCTKEVHEINGW